MTASFLSVQPQTLAPSSLLPRPRPSPLFRRTSTLPLRRRAPGGHSAVAKFGLQPPFFFDAESSQGVLTEVFERAESLLYTIADAAVSSSDSAVAVSNQSNRDWLSGIADSMETVLKVLKGGLSAVHAPYAYGFAIILLTVLVKAATFPLTKKQVESAMAMRSLQPQIQAIQKRYAGDKERIQLETARLYKSAGINPLAGCLPTLATIPVWIGLYRALSNVANEGLLTEGFFWIPSLSGPTTIAAKQTGSGISWLFPFVDGHPPLGWSDTFAYLVLPLLLVVSQYISVQIMQTVQSNDPNQKSSQALTKVLPLMIGYFALSVPSGLSLYWLTNNILSTGQQIWLQKLGGAKNPILQYIETKSEEEPPKVQMNDLVKPNKMEHEVKETTPSGGHRPGERFKQIKEQEAMRKREREEEKRREAEAAKELAVEREEEKHENALVVASNDVERVAAVNGVSATQELKEQQSESILSEMTSDVAATNGTGAVKEHPFQNLKEEKSAQPSTSHTENGPTESSAHGRIN